MNELEWTSFKDGQVFKEISVRKRYGEKDLVLFIQLYFDDFNLTGNKSTQISVVYFTVANLPPFLNCSRDSIHLLFVIKREYLDVIKFEGLFEKLFEDFARLERDPIALSLGYTARIEFETSVADNSGKIN